HLALHSFPTRRSSDLQRYIKENSERAKGIMWGMSLDMVGENTEKTGGSFLIEKMPDPSAIWTRGDDKHTEWGAGDVQETDLFPQDRKSTRLNSSHVKI